MQDAVKRGSVGCLLLILAACAAVDGDPGDRGVRALSRTGGERVMQVGYLEIVTEDVDAVCAAYAAANGVEFGARVDALGGARTAELAGGGKVGVRGPLRESEDPVVRPYWLVDDIEAALDAAVEAGGEVALPPMEITGYGTCAIYIHAGVQHGLWQR